MQFNLSDDEIVRRGEEIYERSIRAQVEPTRNGEFLLINVETGEYEIGPDDEAVSARASERFPGTPLFFMRVGRKAAYRIGGNFIVRPAC